MDDLTFIFKLTDSDTMAMHILNVIHTSVTTRDFFIIIGKSMNMHKERKGISYSVKEVNLESVISPNTHLFIAWRK